MFLALFEFPRPPTIYLGSNYNPSGRRNTLVIMAMASDNAELRHVEIASLGAGVLFLGVLYAMLCSYHNRHQLRRMLDDDTHNF